MNAPAPVSYIGQAPFKVPATIGGQTAQRGVTADIPTNAPATTGTAHGDVLSWLDKNRDPLLVGIFSSVAAVWLTLKLFGRR